MVAPNVATNNLFTNFRQRRWCSYGTGGGGGMSENLKHLHALVQLAEQPSSEARRAVLEGVSELFMADGMRLSERETGLAGDILSRISDEVEQDLRAEMAERFADAPHAPHDLIRKLANDVFDVAAPVLMRSGVLTDADLIEIVANRGQSHRLAVANRPEVSEAVSEALVEVGDDEVLETLVRNEGASISRGTMSRIVARSKETESLQRPLAMRRDMPAEFLHEMLHWVGDAIKRVIASRADVDEATLNRIIAKSEATLVSGAFAGERELSAAKREIVRLARQGKLTPDSLSDFLRQKDIPKFIVALARMIDVDAETARHIAFSPDYEAIAVACRAARVEGTIFATIVQLMDQHDAFNIGREPVQKRELLEYYLAMPEETAQRAMRFWRIRQKAMSTSNHPTAA